MSIKKQARRPRSADTCKGVPRNTSFLVRLQLGYIGAIYLCCHRFQFLARRQRLAEHHAEQWSVSVWPL